jgi:hypothetical protein
MDCQKEKEKSDCLDYAQWMHARVRDLTREMLKQAEGARVLELPTILNTKTMREMETKIEKAIADNRMGALTLLCLDYEDGMRAHCEWIVREAQKEKAKGAAA